MIIFLKSSLNTVGRAKHFAANKLTASYLDSLRNLEHFLNVEEDWHSCESERDQDGKG